eukprot:m.269316 g.269316  ORF g.269316 m.269316 type:complete len:51 (-) comp15670_c0_seq8:870-1022(-)
MGLGVSISIQFNSSFRVLFATVATQAEFVSSSVAPRFAYKHHRNLLPSWQ